MKQILIFHIEDLTFGLDLVYIERVIRAIEIHPSPQNASFLLGLLYLYEEWIPVVNMRALLGLKEKELELTDQLIICHHESRKIALLVDQVEFLASIDSHHISQNVFSTHPLTQRLAYYKEKPIFLPPFDLLLLLSNPHLKEGIEDGK